MAKLTRRERITIGMCGTGIINGKLVKQSSILKNSRFYNFLIKIHQEKNILDVYFEVFGGNPWDQPLPIDNKLDMFNYFLEKIES